MSSSKNYAKVRASRNPPLKGDLEALGGLKGACQTCFDIRRIWKDRAKDVFYKALDTNHYLAEEEPDGAFEALNEFFGA